MNLLEDIKNIVAHDREHSVRVLVDSLGVTVYLDYDPERNYEEKCLLPIKYETLGEFAFIPDDEYRESYNPGDYGIDLPEIELVSKIMRYMENHKEEIEALCRGFSIDFKERSKVAEAA